MHCSHSEEFKSTTLIHEIEAHSAEMEADQNAAEIKIYDECEVTSTRC
jgi:hypothetical protein